MSRRAGLAVAAGVAAFALVTTGVGIASGAPPQFLAADLVTGLSFVVGGLVAVWLRPASAVGPMLLVSGGLWYVGSYAPTGHPVLAPLGYAFEKYYDLVLAALLLVLSSPARRLEPRPLIALLGGAMVVRSLDRLLVDPRSPFTLWPNQAAFETVEVASDLAIAALAALVGVIAFHRLLRGGAVARRVRWPILFAGTIAMAAAAYQAFDAAWATAANAPVVTFAEPWAEIVAWLGYGLRTLVPIGFLVATLRDRTAPGPLGPFAAGLEGPLGTGTLADTLRTALGDPSLHLLRPAGSGSWLAEDGVETSLAPADEGHTVTLVGPADRPLAVIVHDAALVEQPELLRAVARVLRLALENERLEAELREQLQAVTESRARIVTAAEDERRRVERDLHDGAQQRLVAVMLALQQARRTADVAAVPEALRLELDAATRETTEAARELRELARGIHPAILEDEGLGAAVAALARRVGLPVEVRIGLDGRLPRLVESTAYFTIAEALTNTQRHADASRASVRLDRTDDSLEIEVSDDGRGGAAPERGSGLRGLADRVTALGGRLEVDSEPGRGTRVKATIPADR